MWSNFAIDYLHHTIQTDTSKNKQTNSVAISLQANYTDRVTAVVEEVSADFCA
jgi:hypothetical protein